MNTAFLQGAPTAGNYVAALANHAPLGMAGVGLNIVGIPLMLVGTVRNVVSAVLAKLRVVDRSQAIVRVRDAGLGRG